MRLDGLSRKKPKTLSGIETFYQMLQDPELRAGKNLKPYQGLKQIWKLQCLSKEEKAGKNLKPYQGLKRGF